MLTKEEFKGLFLTEELGSGTDEWKRETKATWMEGNTNLKGGKNFSLEGNVGLKPT